VEQQQGPPGRLLGPLFVPPRTRAPYACDPATSLGRFYPEGESPTRTCYQRDRDRIIHSTAFRRLKHKTQVFVQHEGDYYRTRLTHSLEVAQIARSVARLFALDEDLAETVALAHDLGHTPFGHAGEEALNDVTKDFGGFDHNAHALELVTALEHRYADFDGLNLTWETLEGLVKHNGPLAGAGKPVSGPIASFDQRWPLELSSWPGLEAQIAALADDIAYVNHDIDDGLRASLFTVEDLSDAPLVGAYVREIGVRYGSLEFGRLVGEIVRRLMSAMIGDMIGETRRRVDRAQPGSVDEVRRQAAALAAFSGDMAERVADLKGFLFARMYRHPKVTRTMEAAKQVVRDLFSAFVADPAQLPPDWRNLCREDDGSCAVSTVRDYIAGMTDRFALQEYKRILGRELPLLPS
jgi:dGTPase